MDGCVVVSASRCLTRPATCRKRPKPHCCQRWRWTDCAPPLHRCAALSRRCGCGERGRQKHPAHQRPFRPNLLPWCQRRRRCHLCRPAPSHCRQSPWLRRYCMCPSPRFPHFWWPARIGQPRPLNRPRRRQPIPRLPCTQASKATGMQMPRHKAKRPACLCPPSMRPWSGRALNCHQRPHCPRPCQRP